jgi:hypothetical protein
MKRIKHHTGKRRTQLFKRLLKTKVTGHLDISGCKKQHLSIDKVLPTVAFLANIHRLVINVAFKCHLCAAP